MDFYFIQVDMTSFYFERKDLKRFPYHASYRISLCIALGLVHKLLFLQGGTNLEQVEFRIFSGQKIKYHQNKIGFDFNHLI